MGAGSRRNRIW